MAEHKFPWEDEAQAGHKMPAGLPLHDQMAYSTIRNIGVSLRRGTITDAVAAEERGWVRRAYDMAAEGWAFQERMAKAQAKRFKAAEAVATICRLNPTPENTMRLVNVLDGLEVEVDE